MGKDPAFLFYPNDYLGGTMGMTFEEKGAYMELLMMQFNRGHMTGHMIGQTIGQLWGRIEGKFTVDEQGLYYNERLEKEIEKRRNYVDSRKNNKLGINQYTKQNRSYDQSYDHGVTSHMIGHMENRNRNRNIVDNIDTTADNKKNKRTKNKVDVVLKEDDKLFEELWSALPRREGKSKVTEETKRKIYLVGKEKMLYAIRKYKSKIERLQTEPKYIMMGSTFMNGGYLDFLEGYKEEKTDLEVLAEKSEKGTIILDIEKMFAEGEKGELEGIGKPKCANR